jgi:uncharacterized protein (DUF302 family)
MISQTTRYGFSVTVPLTFTDAVARTRDALASQGFGILTESTSQPPSG